MRDGGFSGLLSLLWLGRARRSERAGLGDAVHRTLTELLASAPLLGSDGRIISRTGYHRRDKIFLSPTIEIPPVPAKPTQQDVDQALNLILVSYLGDFPFADDASKSLSHKGNRRGSSDVEMG